MLARGRLALGAKIFRGIDLWLDRGDDGFGDLILYGEHVGEAAVIVLRPDVAAGGRVVELGGDAYAVAALAHSARDHIADAGAPRRSAQRGRPCPCR